MSSQSILVNIRPQNQGGWRMGDDVEIHVEDVITLTQLKSIISKLRPHISKHRIQFRMQGNKLVSVSLYDWTLRRHGKSIVDMVYGYICAYTTGIGTIRTTSAALPAQCSRRIVLTHEFIFNASIVTSMLCIRSDP